MALDICQYKPLGTRCTTSSRHFREGVNERFAFVFEKLCTLLAQGTNTTSTTTTSTAIPTTSTTSTTLAPTTTTSTTLAPTSTTTSTTLSPTTTTSTTIHITSTSTTSTTLAPTTSTTTTTLAPTTSTTTTLAPSTTTTTTVPIIVQGGFEIVLIGTDPVDLNNHNTLQISDDDKINFVDNSGNVFTLDLSEPTYDPSIITSSTTLNIEGFRLTKRINASAGNITITLNPSFAGQLVNLKRMDNSGNTITVQLTSGTIDDQPSTVIVSQYDNLQLEFQTLTEAIIL